MTQSGDRDPAEGASDPARPARGSETELDIDVEVRVSVRASARPAVDASGVSADSDEWDPEDDEALRWAGDDETGRDTPRLRGVDSAADPVAPESTEPRRPGDTARAAAAAVFALPYLAWTIGWILAVQQMSSGAGQLFGEIVWQFGEFLAILAAPLWFAATLTLTREARPLARVGGLALGAGLLVPWPLVLQFLAALSFAGSLS